MRKGQKMLKWQAIIYIYIRTWKGQLYSVSCCEGCSLAESFGPHYGSVVPGFNFAENETPWNSIL